MVDNHANNQHEMGDAAEKKQLKPSDKPPTGTPIVTEKDNNLQQKQESQTAMQAKRFTGPLDVAFTIDMGDGKLVGDKRPLRVEEVHSVNQTMLHVRDLIHANNRHPDAENALKAICDNISRERREHPKEFKEYLALLNKAIAHEPHINDVLMPGTKFVDADMKGCVYGENPVTHNRFVYANESGRLVAIEDEDRNHIRRVWDIHGHPLRVDIKFDDGSREVFQNAHVVRFDAHGQQTWTRDIGDVLPTLLKEKYGNDLVSKLPDRDLTIASVEMMREHMPAFGDRNTIARTIMHATDPKEAMAAALAYAYTENHNENLTNATLDEMAHDSKKFASRAAGVREIFKRGSSDSDYMPKDLGNLVHIKQGQIPICNVEAVVAGLATTPHGRDILAGKGTPTGMPLIQEDVNGSYIVSFPGDQFDNFHVTKPTLGERMIYASCDGGGLYAAILDKAYAQRILNHLDMGMELGELWDRKDKGWTDRGIIPGAASHFIRDNDFALRLLSPPDSQVRSLLLDQIPDAEIEQRITNALANGRAVTCDTQPLHDPELTLPDGTLVRLDKAHALTILECKTGLVTLYDPHGYLVDPDGHKIPNSNGIIRNVPIAALRNILRDINVSS